MAFILCSLSAQGSAQRSSRYVATTVGDVVQLSDSQKGVTVSIAPHMGDMVFSMRVHGQEIVHFPFPTLEAFRSQSSLAGIPLLAPWANRLDEFAFYANGKRYQLNPSLGNILGDLPTHGFLSKVPDWQVVELKADERSVWLTSRLDFYKHPDWMEQFPFAHTIEITQRLQDGVLEIHTRIVNLSTEPMPVIIGFHPFLQLTDLDKAQWRLNLPATKHYLLQPNDVPTGSTEPVARRVKDPAQVDPGELDDVFGDLTRDGNGNAQFILSGRRQSLHITFGPRYLVGIVYSPRTAPAQAGLPSHPTPSADSFVCIEPMASITDATNLDHAGKTVPLQSVAPGAAWEESFWIEPRDF